MPKLSLDAWTSAVLWLAPLAVVSTSLAAENPLSGVWRGRFEYPEESRQPPVEFRLILLQQGERLLGLMDEENTFGTTDAPRLHASVTGTYSPTNAAGGALLLHKTYDGTSGAEHSVAYIGTYYEGTDAIVGLWTIPGDWSGLFQMQREPHTSGGPLAGVWSGKYRYPPEAALPPVPFLAVLVHQGEHEVRGWIREPNTFGAPGEPFLQAEATGAFDPRKQVLRLTKTYDGTAGQSHEVHYIGRLGEDFQCEGTWQIPGSWGAGFRMAPVRGPVARHLLEERVEAPPPSAVGPGGPDLEIHRPPAPPVR